MNLGAIVIITVALVGLFAGYPIVLFYIRKKPPAIGFNLGGINATGQVPDLPGLRQLIDPDTPTEVMTRRGITDGQDYHLVFSDEFNKDGRSFYPGDDPYWEGVDLNYWPTGDLEWYDPQAVTTKNGSLVIELAEILNHDLNFRSGMLQSWNKFCFTTGIIEARVSLPGRGDTPGYVKCLNPIISSCSLLSVSGLVCGCWVMLLVQAMELQRKVNQFLRHRLRPLTRYRYLAIFL